MSEIIEVFEQTGTFGFRLAVGEERTNYSFGFPTIQGAKSAARRNFSNHLPKRVVWEAAQRPDTDHSEITVRATLELLRARR